MKSFIVSGGITFFIIVFFMSVFEPKINVVLNKVSDSVYIVFGIALLISYLLSLFWGVTGIIKGQRILNAIGIMISIGGLMLFYGILFTQYGGRSKEAPGQFDHAIDKINVPQRLILDSLLAQTSTNMLDVKLVPYWGMNKNPGAFVICIQKNNIIALQIKNKPVSNCRLISKLNTIEWLILDSCGLKSIDELYLPKLQRLSVNNNQLTNLAGIEKESQIGWLEFSGNPITDSAAIKIHPNKSINILN